MSSSSSSSSSSRSSSRSSSSSCGPLDEAPSGLEAVNLSRKQREAWRKMSEHEERLQQAVLHLEAPLPKQVANCMFQSGMENDVF